jgi:hypothetical protein
VKSDNDDAQYERVVEHMERMLPDDMTEEEVRADWTVAMEWNTKRIAYVFDEIARAKKAGRHMLAAKLGYLLDISVNAICVHLVNDVPRYEIHEEMARHGFRPNPFNN